MKNFVQCGDTVSLVAPYAVNPGDGLLVGALFGIAASAAAVGANVEAVTEGVFDITALSTDAASQGVKAYWDNANRRVTVSAAGNSLIGVLAVAKTAGDGTARVRLNGVSV